MQLYRIATTINISIIHVVRRLLYIFIEKKLLITICYLHVE